MSSKILTTIAPALLTIATFGQETEIDNLIENSLEYLTEGEELTDDSFLYLAELLRSYHENPLNLNNAKKYELEELALLRDNQIEALLNHIVANGQLIILEELQSIPGFDLNTIHRIRPFVAVKSIKENPLPAAHHSYERKLKNRVFIRYRRIMEQQQGYRNPDGAYLGSPYNLYSRCRIEINDKTRLGFTTEKDPGEEFFNGSQKKGFDFYSGYYLWKSANNRKKFILGDFHVQFGQGLTAWSGNGSGKSADVMQIKRISRGLLPSASANENGFLRGIGYSFEPATNWKTTLFLSAAPVDAAIEEDKVMSLSETGLHRTTNEVSKKNNLLRVTAGGRLEKNNRRFRQGITYINSRLLTKQYNTNNQLLSRVGSDFSWQVQNTSLFCEASTDESFNKAFLTGIMTVPDKHLSLGIYYRNADPGFNSAFANAKMENSYVQNENGTYFSMVITSLKKTTVSTYYDIFRFPWLKHLTDAPSNGNDLLLQVEYKHSKKLLLLARAKRKMKEKNHTEGANLLNIPVRESSIGYRLELQHKVNDFIRIKSRIETKTYRLGKNNPEEGILLLQDIQYKKDGRPFSLTLRHALFNTDSYNCRIYAYENDVLYAFSVPAYYGNGRKYYVLLKYRFSRYFSVWLRYARIYFTDRLEIGSGNERINGNTKSELKLQLQVNF